MKSGDPEMPVDVGMKNGNVAVSDDPFGSLPEPPEVDPIDDLHGSVTASCTKDSPDTGIVQRPLKVLPPFFDRSGELPVLCIQVATLFHL
jgi:hypothetical protein